MQRNKDQYIELGGNKPGLPTIAVIFTGGTISQMPDHNGILVSALSGVELVRNHPVIRDIARIKLVEYSNIDSIQMHPSHWLQISKIANNFLRQPDIAGVVIVHGTDTMVEGAYFLDLTIDSKKPVVFTGAMKDAANNSFDGIANLYDAMMQAISKEAYNWGVTITLNQYVNSARDVYKMHSTNRQAFCSGEKGYLGYIERGKVRRFRDRIDKLYIPLPKEQLAEVALIKTYAGDDGSLLSAAVAAKFQGIVIEGFGSGSVNLSVSKAINYAISKKTPVVVTSETCNGGVDPVYGSAGGSAALKKLGAILGEDLSGNKARLLLMLLLSTGVLKKDLGKHFSCEQKSVQ